VLIQLCRLPQLEDIRVDSCGYSIDGRSSKWAIPPIDDAVDIKTSHYTDIYALGNLQRQVMANRRKMGRPELPEDDVEFKYRRAKTQSLEDYLAHLSLGDEEYEAL
jgi:hypothetical protein